GGGGVLDDPHDLIHALVALPPVDRRHVVDEAIEFVGERGRRCRRGRRRGNAEQALAARLFLVLARPRSEPCGRIPSVVIEPDAGALLLWFLATPVARVPLGFVAVDALEDGVL